MVAKRAARFCVPVIMALLLLSCASPAAMQEKGSMVAPESRFTILQVNDVYKIEGLEGGDVGGIARLRTLRKKLEAGGSPVLVLHAGDILFPSVMSRYLRAQPMIRTLNLLDGNPAAFDQNLVAVFGNHEFDDKDPGVILGRIAQSDFSWVSSNVRYRSTKDAPGEPFSGRLKNVHDVLVLEVGNVHVGIFGLTVDSQRRDYVAYDYEITTRHAIVRAAINHLKSKGSRVIIALTHQDLDQDRLLATDFPEIDFIIGGHEHFFIKEQVGHTWITKADADAKSAVVYDVKAPLNAPVEATPRKVDIGRDIEKDPIVEEEVKRSLQELSDTIAKQTGRNSQEEIGRTEYMLEGIEPSVRGKETALGNFLADVIRERMNTDIAFVNGGGIRINDNIPPGPIRVYDIEGIFYYDNVLTAFELTGSEIIDILRNSVSKTHLGDGRFLQVSGIRFKYHVDETSQNPVYRINQADVEVMPRGATGYVPLEINKTYSVGTTDYIWENGYQDGYKVFSKGNNMTSPRRLDKPPFIGFRKATEEKITSLKDRTVTTRIEGRIIAVPQ
ncbi:MAG: bifunctional metallophosphatase/5'-nucleotidase [Candidatus Brocadiaceae bacterium]|nr:bifunctional metallophosphatase/5'-nucleotidase [Candidatus Brocadiaceae bacterium]